MIFFFFKLWMFRQTTKYLNYFFLNYECSYMLTWNNQNSFNTRKRDRAPRFFFWHSSNTQQLTHSPAFFIFIASRRHAEAIFDSLYLINSYSIKDISRIYLAIVSVSMDALAHYQKVFKLSLKNQTFISLYVWNLQDNSSCIFRLIKWKKQFKKSFTVTSNNIFWLMYKIIK